MAPRRLGFGSAIVVGALPLILADWGMILVHFARTPLKDRAFHLDYVAGHRLFLALTCAVAVAAYRALAGRLPRWIAPIVTCAVAYPLCHFAFAEDFQGFPRRFRIPLTLAAAVGPTLFAAIGVFLRERWIARAACALASIALTVANQTLLKLNYPGFHLTCIVLGQIALGIALSELAVPARLALPTWARASRDLLLALIAAWSIVIPPRDRVAVLLATDDAAPVYRYASEFYRDDDEDLAGAAPENNPYFASRLTARPVPAGAPLLDRRDLVVLFLSFDALRYDVASGQHGGHFAALDEMKAEGTVFENAYAPATSTSGTMSQMFSGRYYSEIHWVEAEIQGKHTHVPADSDNIRFPGLLTDAGVATYLVPTHWRISQWGKMVSGFAEEYKPQVKGYRKSKEALPALLKWLKKHQTGRAFAYCHMIDAHAPYDSRGTNGTPFENYLGELQAADAQVADLFAELKQTKLWDRTIVIMTADHGEAFGEHGQKYHTGWAYEELLHVPLIIRVPGRPKATVSEVVTLLDLGPTILDLFGVDTPGPFMGQSLAPILRGEEPDFQRPVAFHTTKRQFGIVYPDRVKALYHLKKKRKEVYDLKVDPNEENNVADEEWARQRIRRVRALFKAHEYQGLGYEVPGQDL